MMSEQPADGRMGAPALIPSPPVPTTPPTRDEAALVLADVVVRLVWLGEVTDLPAQQLQSLGVAVHAVSGVAEVVNAEVSLAYVRANAPSPGATTP